MSPPSQQPARHLGLDASGPVLWAVRYGGTQTAPPGYDYWFDNRKRSGAQWVVQSSLAGSIDVTLHGKTQPAPAGTMIVFRYDEDSQYGQRRPLTHPYRNRWVSPVGAGIEEHMQQLRAATGPVLDLGLDHPLHESLAELVGLLDPQRSVDAIRSAGLVHRFVMGLLDFAQAARREAQPAVDRAVDQLVEHPLDPIDTQRIANRYGVSREHLTRVFRQRTGETPARYLDTRRVDHALSLLRVTDLPLDDIARQSGLRSARHLADRVRARTGRPPSAMRQLA
ncbi:MAG: AraC family transcriptional regulator [Planctomycetota bacterium]